MINFDILAEKELGNLLYFIEKEFDDKIDCNLLDGVLSIEFESGEQIVVNKHLASEKIWFSSPASGVKYFSYQNNNFFDTKTGELLLDILKNDIIKLAL